MFGSINSDWKVKIQNTIKLINLQEVLPLMKWENFNDILNREKRPRYQESKLKWGCMRSVTEEWKIKGSTGKLYVILKEIVASVDLKI